MSKRRRPSNGVSNGASGGASNTAPNGAPDSPHFPQPSPLPPIPAGAPIIGDLPPLGLRMGDIPLEFPPSLAAAIAKARDSNQKYMIAVWVYEGGEENAISLHLTRGAGWSFDWILRAFGQLKKLIFDIEPPTADGADGAKATAEANGSAKQ